MTTVIILHNIRSTHNVGSIFRTADGAGVSHIYLTGYTPAPVDRFGRVRSDIAKTALGAEESVPWTHEPDFRTCMQKLRDEKYTIVSVEQDARSVSYTQLQHTENYALIFGNEVDGIPADVLDASDVIAEIPLHGSKESLNVSVVAGVVLFGLRHERCAPASAARATKPQ